MQWLMRLVVAAAAAAAFVAAGVLLSGGVDFRLGSLPVRFRDPFLPSVLACGLAAIAFARRPVAAAALGWWRARIIRADRVLALVLAAAVCAAGTFWGTRVAGGSDSYCYLNQAELIADGRLTEPQPLAAGAPFESGLWPFVPAGHVPVPGGALAIAPMCPAGYPVLMAAARHVAGRAGMFAVVPLCGALAIWLTFLLGRRVAGPGTGLFSAALLASSPIFLYQVVQPMTDVPAVALWTLALAAATSPRRRDSDVGWPLLTGLAAGAALIVRPNLLPLAGLLGVWVLLQRTATVRAGGWTALLRPAVAYSIGVLPFALAVAAANEAMYGSPLRSGYGDLGALFRLAHIVPNLARYPVWLVETQTPFVLLAVAAPLAPRHRLPGARELVWLLLSFAVVVFACYVAYSVFDAWWFLRFALPALPPLLVLSVSTAGALLDRVPVATRTIAHAVAGILLVALQLSIAAERDVFRLRAFEQRFRDGGMYVAERLPGNAAVVTMMQTGSVRFYSGRPTLNWDALGPAELDAAVDFLASHGYRPYLLLERAEVADFRRRFGGRTKIGSLEWPPMAEINRDVTIYDPADYARYMKGESIRTDRVRTRRGGQVR